MRSAPAPLALFLCHANTAASIMAEAILRHLAQGRVRAASAGETLYGRVNHYALECLHAHGIATQGLRSRMWGEFWGLDKPPVRFLIALGDVYAAGSTWSPDTIIARWYMPDPGAVAAGSEIDIRLGFEEGFSTLESRIRKFLALTSGQLTDGALSRELALIGQSPMSDSGDAKKSRFSTVQNRLPSEVQASQELPDDYLWRKVQPPSAKLRAKRGWLLQRLSTLISSAQRKSVEVRARKPVHVDVGEATKPERAPRPGMTGLLPNAAVEAEVSCENHPECDFECYKCRDAWYRFTHTQLAAPEDEAEMMARWVAAAKNHLET